MVTFAQLEKMSEGEAILTLVNRCDWSYSEAEAFVNQYCRCSKPVIIKVEEGLYSVNEIRQIVDKVLAKKTE